MNPSSPRVSKRLGSLLLAIGLSLASTAAAHAAEASPAASAEPASPAVTVPAAPAALAAPTAPADGPVAPEGEALEWGGPVAAIAIAVETQKTSTCIDCDSQENFCSSGAQCNSFCQALVGENGFCMPACGCCVCPEVPPGGGDGEPFPDNCQPVCRCDGVSGNQGACDPGCRQVNCI